MSNWLRSAGLDDLIHSLAVAYFAGQSANLKLNLLVCEFLPTTTICGE